MQPIPSPGESGLFGSGLRDPSGGFGGIKNVRRARDFSFAPSDAKSGSSTYVCPSCGKANLSEGQFFDHMLKRHRSERLLVICPLCNAAPLSHHTYRKGTLIDHLKQRHKKSSEKLQKSRVLRRLVRQGGGKNVGPFAEFLATLDPDEASKLLERIENGESLAEVFASAKAESTCVVEHNADSLLRPVVPTINGDVAQNDVERTKKSMFVQELLLSTLV